MVAPSSEPPSDSNLLFAVLALQRGFLDQDKFVDACAAWAARRDTPIPELLIERSWITPDDRRQLQDDINRLLRKHHGNVRASIHELAEADQGVQRSLGNLLLDPAWGNLHASDLLESGELKTPRPHDRYQRLGEPKRGGIGQVWRAKDRHLGRVVALKELRPDRVLSGELRDRFLAEAKIISQLMHPNIIPAFELVERGGLDGPFYTMQFVNGDTLSDAIRDFHVRRKQGQAGNLELRRLLGAFAAVCKAVDYAHGRGILHRDLKGSNVILGEHGEVFLLDWGMAKVIGDHPANARVDPVVLASMAAATETKAGDKLGTPAYMAPEQAAGETDQIDPRTDVYALGVILYEILTNRLPFGAEATPSLFADLPADPDARKKELSQRQINRILYQIIHAPTPAPRGVDSLAPIPLEKVCLKALSKVKAERYASASELAREIERWLADEPVSGWREPWTVRVGRWMRRHRPWVAGAVSLLAAALPLLTIMIVLSERARENQEVEQGKTKDALEKLEAEQGKTKNALDVAIKNEADATAARDALETTLARSLLRPLGLQSSVQPMTDPEWEALWELASNRKTSLGYRFVEEASRGPVTSRQLRNRAALAFHAALGLDARRRDEVEAMLRSRLNNSFIGAEQKTDLALAASAWGALSASGSARVAQELIQAIEDNKDQRASEDLVNALVVVAFRMDAKEAAATLTRAIKGNKNEIIASSLVAGLSAVAARMDPKEAALAAAILTRAIKDNNNNPIALRPLVAGLSAVAARMGPKEAAATLIQAIMDNTDLDSSVWLAWGLPAVAARLDPKDAAQAAATLARAIEDSNNRPFALNSLAHCLSAVAARMDPKEAADATRQAAATLTGAIKDSNNNPIALSWLAPGLSAVAARMDPKEAADATRQAAATLTRAIKDNENPRVLEALLQGLWAVSAPMDPKEAATILTRAIKDNNNKPFALGRLALALSMAAARLDTKEAADASRQAAAILTQAMKNYNDAPIVSRTLAQGLSAVAARMDSKEAATTLVQAIKDTKDLGSVVWLAQGLSVLAARMDPKDAAQAAIILARAIKDSKMPFADLRPLAESLSAVAAHMDPKEAAATLSRAIKDNENPDVLKPLAQGLSTVVARMDPKEAAAATKEAAATLTRAIKDNNNNPFFELGPVAEGLSVLAARMDPEEAVATLSRAIKDNENPNVFEPLAQGLSAVVARMGPKEAATTLTRAIKDNNNKPFALGPLALALSTAAARLDTKEAADASRQAAATLTQAMKNYNDVPIFSRTLAQGLSAVAARMDSKEATTTLIQTIKDKNKDRLALEDLAQGLSVVAARTNPGEAAQVAAILTRAIEDNKNLNMVVWLGQGLSAVAARMGPGEAAQAVAILTRAIKDNKDPSDLSRLASALSGVVSQIGPEEAADATMQAATKLLQVEAHESFGRAEIGTPQAWISRDDYLFRDALLLITSGPEASWRVASVTCAGAGHPLTALPFLMAAAQTPFCRLSTQQLVELLKLPACVGNRQYMILDCLGHRLQRRFTDLWEFVAWAREHEPDLNLTEPPKLPDSSPPAAGR